MTRVCGPSTILRYRGKTVPFSWPGEKPAYLQSMSSLGFRCSLAASSPVMQALTRLPIDHSPRGFLHSSRRSSYLPTYLPTYLPIYQCLLICRSIYPRPLIILRGGTRITFPFGVTIVLFSLLWLDTL